MIKKIEKKLLNLCEKDKFDEERWVELSTELRRIDPYNDIFHLACKSWPNCEDYGCCE